VDIPLWLLAEQKESEKELPESLQKLEQMF
jgi:hypothetical protein